MANDRLMTGQSKGAAIGWYTIVVSPIAEDVAASPPEAGKFTDPNKNLAPSGREVNKKYQVPAMSGLGIEVVEKPAAGAYNLMVTK